MLKPDRDVGIVGYGAYVPRYRLPAAEVARVWTDGSGGLPIKEKAVAGLDEDTLTMSLEAARNALARARIDPQDLRAVWVGSESHPYAVKPTSTIVAEAIGATPYVQAADLEFACKAGSEAIVMGVGIVGSGMGRYVLAIGMDTAQGRPGDALEYTAASGARPLSSARPRRASRSTKRCYRTLPTRRTSGGGPMRTIPATATASPASRPISNTSPARAGSSWTSWAQGRPITRTRSSISRTPNSRSARPRCWGSRQEQIKTGLLVPVIGNTYAGSSLIGLTAILDEAKPGDRVFMVSFGSGAGSDAFSIRVTDRILEARDRAPKTQDYIARRVVIDYATYARYRHKLQMK